MPSRGAQLRPPLRVAEQRDDRLGEGARIVGAGVVASGPDAEPFGADGRGNDGPGHRQRLENLQARPAAGA